MAAKTKGTVRKRLERLQIGRSTLFKVEGGSFEMGRMRSAIVSAARGAGIEVSTHKTERGIKATRLS